MAEVYLIHFTIPLGHSQHYLGRTCLTAPERLKRHLSGNGAKLIDLARKIPDNQFVIVRVWHTDTYAASAELEHKLKARHENVRLCPVCNPATAIKWANYPKLQSKESATNEN